MRTLEHLALTLTKNHGGQYADHLLTLKHLTPHYSTTELINYYRINHSHNLVEPCYNKRRGGAEE